MNNTSHDPLSIKMITIAVANQKGGVGKTTISFNLSHILANLHRQRVLTVDNDPQGNLTSSLLEDPSKLDAHTLKAYNEEPFMPMQISENLYLLGSDITLAQVAERDFQVISKLKERIKRIDVSTEVGGFDYVVIDCLPSFGQLVKTSKSADHKRHFWQNHGKNSQKCGKV